MKFIKKFESFHKTGVDEGGEMIPEHNPVLSLKIKEYVDGLITKGRFDDLAKIIGEKLPKDLESGQMDQYGDELGERAKKFLEKNPELIGKEINYQTYKVPGGDGIARTNKVGGVLGQ